MGVFDLLRLDGGRAVVTGGSAGLGLEIASALGEAGAELVIAGRDPKRLESARRHLEEHAPRVGTVEADLATPESAVAFCERILNEFEPVDILVNNVGGRRINYPTEDMPLDEWQRIIDLNLTQAFICTRLIGGAMLPRRHGRIINVSSISGFVAGKSMRGRSYETSKAALSMFTKAVAADWASHNVNVNAIAPGTFLTDANRRWFEIRPELQPEIEATIPMGRLGRPEEIGPLAVYLASDAASYMTGSVIVIDGGRTLW